MEMRILFPAFHYIWFCQLIRTWGGAENNSPNAQNYCKHGWQDIRLLVYKPMTPFPKQNLADEFLNIWWKYRTFAEREKKPKQNKICSQKYVNFGQNLVQDWGWLIGTQQNSYSISHLLGTVTTQWLPLWRCSHCSLVPDTVTIEQWLHRTHTLLGIPYCGTYVEICLLGTQ